MESLTYTKTYQIGLISNGEQRGDSTGCPRNTKEVVRERWTTCDEESRLRYVVYLRQASVHVKGSLIPRDPSL